MGKNKNNKNAPTSNEQQASKKKKGGGGYKARMEEEEKKAIEDAANREALKNRVKFVVARHILCSDKSKIEEIHNELTEANGDSPPSEEFA